MPITASARIRSGATTQYPEFLQVFPRNTRASIAPANAIPTSRPPNRACPEAWRTSRRAFVLPIRFGHIVGHFIKFHRKRLDIDARFGSISIFLIALVISVRKQSRICIYARKSLIQHNEEEAY